ncbi:hypothetical protein [Pararobbsia silviterrae]|uniref:Uncharacterized protein n=1 Tax=Pararobbsia silviterrae TaxID=1792498 RepID=A0A494X9F0_9BURK|nr:hypothetical protein [Pararobbsia silviterrae]RKP44729.1 hypothetical protein D7S86_27290 [Pararobbsia silviterrae]
MTDKTKPESGPLYMRAIACPHDIESKSITLHFDPTQAGHNALNQLALRLSTAETTIKQTQRDLVKDAIDSAISFGYLGTNPPASLDHWLAPFWLNGRTAAIGDRLRSAVSFTVARLKGTAKMAAGRITLAPGDEDAVALEQALAPYIAGEGKVPGLKAARALVAAIKDRWDSGGDDRMQQRELAGIVADAMLDEIDQAIEEATHANESTPERHAETPLTTRLSAAAGILAGHGYSDCSAAVFEASKALMLTPREEATA